MTDLPYRPCAGIMLVRGGRVFVGERCDGEVEAWQMPQGGIDPGEEPRAAALRELREETGVRDRDVTVLAEAPDELFYDFPPHLIGRIMKGRYRGQRQRWFLIRLDAGDEAIDIATAHPEFRRWRWADPAELPALAVPFKRAVYERVLAAFAARLSDEFTVS